jgi:hypothetical protein
VTPGLDLHDFSFSNFVAYEATTYAAPFFFERKKKGLSLDNQAHFTMMERNEKLTKLNDQADNHADDDGPL